MKSKEVKEKKRKRRRTAWAPSEIDQIRQLKPIQVPIGNFWRARFWGNWKIKKATKGDDKKASSIHPSIKPWRWWVLDVLILKGEKDMKGKRKRSKKESQFTKENGSKPIVLIYGEM